MSIWNPENIKDVAESVGIASISDDVLAAVGAEIHFRLGQVLEEALRFMRHSRRTILSTRDISQALQVLDVEPLYGYESTRPLRFGEASLGPGQPLFYVEDDEVDFERLINAPLPKVPREIAYTGMHHTPLPSTKANMNSPLVGSRRRSTFDSSESNNGRFSQPGPHAQRSWSKP